MAERINGKDVVRRIISAVEENKVWLSEIDGAIGDGDHGINMSKGCGMALKTIGDQQDSLSGLLRYLGMTLVSNIGGAMGPIYGTFFMRMGKAIEGKETVEKEDLLEMLRSALEGVKKRGGAEVGDKTLVDTLEPALNGYTSALESGKGIREAIDIMIQSAHDGMKSTEALVAKKGRSSRLGERSKGTIDAGAASCFVILRALGESIKKYV